VLGWYLLQARSLPCMATALLFHDGGLSDSRFVQYVMGERTREATAVLYLAMAAGFTAGLHFDADWALRRAVERADPQLLHQV
jgi:hypothetical protein